MKRTITKALIVALPLSLSALSCSKKNNDSGATNFTALKAEALTDISVKVCANSYADMYQKAQELQSVVNLLTTETNDGNLAAARVKWKAIRTTWEQSEAWLFGPVEANNIDPRIDTWPVDFNALERVLAGSDALNEAYVDGLDESLKGFHPIEYLLWGKDGNKTAATFTTREKQYLTALTQNLVKLSKEVYDTWSGGYADQLKNAGGTSTEFTTQHSAYVQIVDAMAGICDEVANAKLKEPFDAQDPKLEESPFAKNSLIDFTNNVQGVLAMYQGRFLVDGKGLEDLVKVNNLALDSEIKAKHAAAIAALSAIDKPFGEAIITEQSKVQNAMTKVNDLADVIDTKLRAYVIQYIK